VHRIKNRSELERRGITPSWVSAETDESLDFFGRHFVRLLFRNDIAEIAGFCESGQYRRHASAPSLVRIEHQDDPRESSSFSCVSESVAPMSGTKPEYVGFVGVQVNGSDVHQDITIR
jgi:hypothetical protein